MAIEEQVAKTLIKYIAIARRKCWRRGTNWSRVCLTKSWFWNDENAIDFRRSDVQEEDEEDITLANFIEKYKSKLMRKNI